MFLSVAPRFGALEPDYLSAITTIGEDLSTKGPFATAAKECADKYKAAEKELLDEIGAAKRDEVSLDAAKITKLIRPMIQPILNFYSQFENQAATAQLVKNKYQGVLGKLLEKMREHTEIGEGNMSEIMGGITKYLKDNASNLDPWLLDTDRQTFKDSFENIQKRWAEWFPPKKS